MGFFDQDNERLETVWFSVLAALSLMCFPFGVRLGRRFPQIPAAKFVPVLCLLLAYENVVQALSNVLANDSPFVLVARATRAAVIPMFLVVMFEVAYAVHKRRSVKFCGIVFDQGHRRSVEPCSWFLRNFVRIVAVMILAVGILVNYDIIVGDDEKAGGTGLVETEDASTHLLLALLPTTGMALIALYIAVYMWKYGNDASIVVQSTICNGWIFLFLGTLALLAGQVPPEWCFRVANESGQVLLLLALIAIGREIGREVQAADDFSSFLEKENELESGSGSNSMSSITPGVQNPKPMGLAPAATRGAIEAEPDGFAAAFVCKEEEVAAIGGRGKHDAGAPGRSGVGKEPGGVGAKQEEGIREHDRSLDDVTRPMEWHMGRPNGGAGNGRPISGIFSKKRPTRTEDHGGGFAGLSESEEERDPRRGSQRDEAQDGAGQRSSAAGDSDGYARGASGMFSSTSSAAAPAVVAVAAEGDKNGSGVVRLAIRSKHVNAV